jgi:hypothetical protein
MMSPHPSFAPGSVKSKTPPVCAPWPWLPTSALSSTDCSRYGLEVAPVAWQIVTCGPCAAPAGWISAPDAARTSPATRDATPVAAIARRFARLIIA